MWERAFAADRPFLFEAVTDPDVPPMPPHISLKQAKSFSWSVLPRDANALGFMRQTFKDVTAGLLHKKP